MSSTIEASWPPEYSAAIKRSREFVADLKTALSLADEVYPLDNQRSNPKGIGLDFLLPPNPAGRGIVRVRFKKRPEGASKYEDLIAGGAVIDVITSGHEMERQRIKVNPHPVKSHPDLEGEYVLSFSDVRLAGKGRAGISRHFIDPRERIEAARQAFQTGILEGSIRSSLSTVFPTRPQQVVDELDGFFRLNISERAFLNHLAGTKLSLGDSVGQFEIKKRAEQYHVDPAKIAGDLQEIQDRVRAMKAQGYDGYFQAVLGELVRTFKLQELRGEALLRHPWVKFMQEELGSLHTVEQLEPILENFPTMTLVDLRDRFMKEAAGLDKTRAHRTTVILLMSTIAIINEGSAIIAQDLSHFTDPETSTIMIRLYAAASALFVWLGGLYSNRHSQRNEYRRSQALKQINHVIRNRESN